MKFSHLNGSYHHHHHHSVYLSHVCWSEFSEQMISLQSLRLRSDITFASGVLNVDYKTLEIPKDPNFRSKNKFKKKTFIRLRNCRPISAVCFDKFKMTNQNFSFLQNVRGTCQITSKRFLSFCRLNRKAPHRLDASHATEDIQKI